ncbi:hypothetical protein H0H93_012471 [Arthromyces matolae]|nr:hypothetical protein H0H93_012471 [Arthromyces matolae]
MSRRAPKLHRIPASRTLRTFSASSSSNAKTSSKTLGTKALETYRRRIKQAIDDRLQSMSVLCLIGCQAEGAIGLEDREREVINAIRDMPDYEGLNDDGDDFVDAGQILDGAVEIDISHAGGEFQQLMEQDLAPRKHRDDHRARKHRILQRNEGFRLQSASMVDAYLEWNERMGISGRVIAVPLTPEEVKGAGTYLLRVVDTYEISDVHVPLLHQGGIPASLVLQGIVPAAPYSPRVGFTIRVLELYRMTHLHCPHLAIQPFVKSLCGLDGSPLRSNLPNQFSIAYNEYLSMREEVELRVHTALLRDSPMWRLKHARPACTYKLEGEEQLVFDMLVTMDGNDSLKRILRRKAGVVDEDGEEEAGASRELKDDREIRGDYYLSRERVDRWAKERVQEMLSDHNDEEDENPCAGRWKNMANELTARMWGIFDETGVFLALCRHGFVLVVADMVQSGELAKYPLAVVEALLDAFGVRIGGGYDIGCKFKTTLDQSPLGPLARKKLYKALVGSFHGHAHNRLCQLSHLARYVEGLGLEDLEGCERFFSKSNALAASTRYASAFHRKQKINEYIQHSDKMDTYPALSTFLVNNYKQAIAIVQGQPALEKQMVDQNIANAGIFKQWLEEERSYLTGLQREPLQETLEMEYYQKLVNLEASRKSFEKASTWSMLTPETFGARDYTQSQETARRHALETMEKDLSVVQELEKRLNITTRWSSTGDDWARAAEMVAKRRYQRCLDTLEALVVSRMFELSKMNLSQTGYKLRRHIAAALKTRSQAIRTALDNYNAAAAAFSPPRAILSWDVVVEYAFLADFDLLADTREDVRERPWAKPAARLVMDEHFKIQRAQEEISRLNIELRRFITYMKDEEEFLKTRQDAILESDPRIAHQIWLQRRRLLLVNEQHRRRIFKLGKLNGFTGCLIPGTSIESATTTAPLTTGSANMEIDEPTATVTRHSDSEDSEDSEEEIEDSEQEKALAERVHNILQITTDI